MTTMIPTATHARTESDVATIAFVAFLGLSILFATGFAKASVLHNSTHDVRHAIGFACH